MTTHLHTCRAMPMQTLNPFQEIVYVIPVATISDIRSKWIEQLRPYIHYSFSLDAYRWQIRTKLDNSLQRIFHDNTLISCLYDPISYDFHSFYFFPPSKFSQSESAIPDSINIGYLSIYHSHSVCTYFDFRAFFSMYYKSQHRCTRLYWHNYIKDLHMKMSFCIVLCDVIFWILTLWYIIKCKHEFKSQKHNQLNKIQNILCPKVTVTFINWIQVGHGLTCKT